MVESSHLEEAVDIDPRLNKLAWEKLKSADGVLVPGGFGVRGIEGKVQAIKYARENNIPFLGICLGMQAAVIEYTRTILNRPLANSKEFSPNIDESNAAIIFMPEGDRNIMGGTMRLGARNTLIKENTIAERLYKRNIISERHRHRYEVNPQLVNELESNGLLFSGKDLETSNRMEIIEIPKQIHPYFVAVQFHPEFQSRPLRPSPVFEGTHMLEIYFYNFVINYKDY